MEIIGRIIQKLDLQKGSSARGEWKKQEFIVETNDKFPKKVCISAWAEKVDDLVRFNVNDSVKVSINIESREYNGKWYTDVRAWKIENSSESSAPRQEENYSQAPVIEDFGNSDTSDDLPF
jgi:hypothetical protein